MVFHVEPLATLLERGLAELGLLPEPETVDRWARFALLLERWNRQLNLSGHRDAGSIARRLLLEAAALCRVLPPAADLADLGSGAGIPGIPIALCRPETRVLLVESRERRHHFQRAVIRELGLENAEPLRGRAEQLVPRPCDGVVAQALSSADRVLVLMRPWVRAGGWVALATTPEGVPQRLPPSQLRSSETRGYSAPGGPERTAWIAFTDPQQAP